MSRPLSGLLAIETIHGAGRGVVAIGPIAAGTNVHVCDQPIAHVLLRQYRKEVCAQCFYYDRGRTLAVRDHEIGKFFCSDACWLAWDQVHGDLGRQAWTAVQRLVQNNASVVAKTAADDISGEPPTVDAIDAAWGAAMLSYGRIENGDLSTTTSEKKNKKKRTATAHLKLLNSDHLNFFTSAALSFHSNPTQWNADIADLIPNERPYQSEHDLRTHCETFMQLVSILPKTLAVDELASVCRNAIAAASFNAFGIRGGGDDAEEYMGFGVYPSASYFNHSCRPNIAKQRTGRSWIFTTKRDIAAGEQCCITYLGGDEKDMNVSERRTRLALPWHFECMCERCEEESKS